MHRAIRSKAFIRILGAFSLIAGVVELFLVLTRAHFVFSAPSAFTAGLAIAPLALVAQIGILVVLSLIGVALAGRGVQLCLTNSQSTEP